MRETGEVDRKTIAAAVKQILVAIGEDSDRDGLKSTPDRVARYYEEVCAGYREDPPAHLETTFEVDHDELILVRDIPFFSLCEHHLVPFFGKVHIAYLPKKGGRITGLSKLARLVDGYAKRLQVQERLTGQIASAVEEKLLPHGVAVVIEAEHLCMAMRGIKKPGTLTVTSSMRGSIRKNASTRQEVLRLMRDGH